MAVVRAGGAAAQLHASQRALTRLARMPHGSHGDTTPTLLYVVGRVNQGIRREMHKRLTHWELTIPEYTALSVLADRPGLSNAQLARRSMIRPQSMIEVLAELEARHLVVREADPAHARILRAELTDEGRRLLASVQPAVDAIEDELLAAVPARQRDTTLKVLVRAMDRLTSGLSEPE
jgi:DNA-binding MarR family transcriptional regulator